MQLVKDLLYAELQEIADLQTEIKLQEEKYLSLLKADKPFHTLKDIRLVIKHLNEQLTTKENHIKNLYN